MAEAGTPTNGNAACSAGCEIAPAQGPDLHIRDQRPEATPATTAVRELLHGFELPPFTLHVGKRPLWLSAATSSTTWPLQHRQRG